MVKAVIFDVDGTLLDTERLYVEAWLEAGRQMGYDIPRELLLKTRGVGVASAVGQIEAAAPGISFSELRRRRVEIAEEMVAAAGNLQKPGVAELIRYLQDRGIPMALATSTGLEKTVRHLAFSGLEGVFDKIVTGDMVEHGKPAPDIFLAAAALLEIRPGNCLVAEDSDAGMRAAQTAGMYSVLIPDIGRITDEVRQSCTAVIRTIDELIPLLETIA